MEDFEKSIHGHDVIEVKSIAQQLQYILLV